MYKYMIKLSIFSISSTSPMAPKTLTCNLVFLLAFSLSNSAKTDSKTQQVKGMFVFGSSLVDNGNNNYLKNSSAKADYSPYGIDFPLGPSGRFSNGRNAIDVLGELLSLPCFIPPFADPRTSGGRILNGVNYASGGSGILDETGQLAGEVVSLNQQISNFEKRTLPYFEAQLRREGCKGRSSRDYLSDYLFVVGTGGNDYLLNYFVPAREQKPSLSQFTQALVSKLTRQLEKLYSLGARKFVLFSIQPIGCTPVVTGNLQLSNGSCIEALNEAALLFNNLLKSQTLNLKQKMPGSNLVFINSYNIIRSIIDNPHAHGFSDASRACCELSTQKGEGILCKRGGKTCANRTSHVFFDGLHPTDAVNSKIAQKAYSSNVMEEAYPTNVRKLVFM